MNTRNIFIIFILFTLFTGCDDVWEPAIENIKDEESIYAEPALAEGLLLQGYLQLPDSHDYNFEFTDVATDNAVSNNYSNVYLSMASGAWAANNNPMSVWDRSYNSILYLNKIIKEAEYIPWAQDPEASQLFNMRMKGEAYGLRAYFMYYLLQAHAGYSNGQLLGVPILTQTSEEITEFNMPRASFNDCVEAVFNDLDEAEKLLPLDFGDLDINAGVIPSKYTSQGINSIGAYNRVLGSRFRGRMTARIAKFIRGEVALLAASPAFLNGSNDSWETAAKAAADLLNENNGLGGLSSNGWTWYANLSDIQAIQDASSPAEIVWRHRTLTHSGINSNIERELFPPSLFGLGRINPSQNLVDAFPMKNGYPISDSQNSGYDTQNPYKDRDPRLDAYVVYDGSKVGVYDTQISMTTTDDAVNATDNSTRTGYYMRKITRKQTNLNPASPASQIFYRARMRYTEMYLDYAEAANEAYGPQGMAPGATYSAYDVIKAIRARAGVGGSNDPYLQSIMSNQDAMRELIHNERRLELCFEGHRFWDLRRWKVPLTKLNEPIRGIKGTSGGNAVFDFTGPYLLSTETRDFKDYMYYGPIPYNETLKWSNLSQNDGWQ
ncbi:RagB/SusD family nutrient uptake outer membrane protein [Confluentibacter sediminis]|uniref:RagB/SusD family nutrient uptake outer membrane protein n=1 Tax=Confluentibacter sediminis TaxID=2219045 RepID=UPI000DAD4A8D|nr:RagB/SusD family nutrient uptake outer membrane protein [Confluentibacter sediminis]